MAFLRITQQWNSMPNFRGCFNWCIGRNRNHHDGNHVAGDDDSDHEDQDKQTKPKENGKYTNNNMYRLANKNIL